MKYRLSITIIICLTVTTSIAQNVESEYLKSWKEFYPTSAAKQGFRSSMLQFEDYSTSAIEQWVNFNSKVLQRVSNSSNEFVKRYPADARLLRVQSQNEIDKYQVLKEHESSLVFYTGIIRRALPEVLAADFLTSAEQSLLICDRLKSIGDLSTAAQANLQQINQSDLENGISEINKSLEYLEALTEEMKDLNVNQCEDFDQVRQSATNKINSLKSFVETTIAPKAIPYSPIIGRDEYARRLALYTDSKLTPDESAEMALKEIELVRDLMGETSKKYLAETYPNQKLPQDLNELVNLALADMQKDVPTSSTDYEEFWNELLQSTLKFLEEKEIVTLPENQTLSIQSAPESAGPAARIGWVGSAPPFDPNPWTTLYLPSIPDTLPEQEQIDFWASFNKPFNRIIVIHELLPGHYMQLKVSRETSHPLRLLFPYGVFIEGWATFCERVALDEGWQDGNHMTMLAHLRKRLENANRAYTSMKVHCEKWDREQVMKFSTEKSLVAPQFAKSLWFRLMRSPMQLTSYFLGGAQFTQLLDSEKERLGESFDLKMFMDTIMKTGPIPIEEFYPIFAKSTD